MLPPPYLDVHRTSLHPASGAGEYARVPSECLRTRTASLVSFQQAGTPAHSDRHCCSYALFFVLFSSRFRVVFEIGGCWVLIGTVVGIAVIVVIASIVVLVGIAVIVAIGAMWGRRG